jgi:hypothetical protein
MNTSKKQWRRIADSRVRHVWKRVCDCARTGGTMAGDEVAMVPPRVRVYPNFHDTFGCIPICDCGKAMVYSHTEILIDKPRQTCRQRRA